MHSLLRSIRQKLLLNNHFVRYFRYALGEILLVVMGILIALQLNNWNTDRIDRHREQKLLLDFKNELLTTREKLLDKQKNRILSFELGSRIKEKWARGEDTYSEFLELKKNDFVIGISNPTIGVLTSMLSSGQIELIRHDSLKYLIAEWKNQLEDLFENETFSWDHSWKNLNFEYTIYPTESETENWTESRKREAYNQLCQSIYWQNTFSSALGSVRHAMTSCKMTLEQLDKMVALIDRESMNDQ